MTPNAVTVLLNTTQAASRLEDLSGSSKCRKRRAASRSIEAEASFSSSAAAVKAAVVVRVLQRGQIYARKAAAAAAIRRIYCTCTSCNALRQRPDVSSKYRPSRTCQQRSLTWQRHRDFVEYPGLGMLAQFIRSGPVVYGPFPSPPLRTDSLQSPLVKFLCFECIYFEKTFPPSGIRSSKCKNHGLMMVG